MNRSLRRFLALALVGAAVSAPAALASGKSDHASTLAKASGTAVTGDPLAAYWGASYRLNLNRPDPALGSAVDAYWRASYRLNLNRPDSTVGSAEDAYWRASYRLNLNRPDPSVGSAQDAHWQASYRLNLNRRDAALGSVATSRPAPIVEQAKGRFDWGDAAVGAGVAAGFIVLLGASLLAVGQRRRRLSTT